MAIDKGSVYYVGYFNGNVSVSEKVKGSNLAMPF
jgi:hypothetical protein